MPPIEGDQPGRHEGAVPRSTLLLAVATPLEPGDPLLGASVVLATHGKQTASLASLSAFVPLREGPQRLQEWCLRTFTLFRRVPSSVE